MAGRYIIPQPGGGYISLPTSYNAKATSTYEVTDGTKIYGTFSSQTKADALKKELKATGIAARVRAVHGVSPKPKAKAVTPKKSAKPAKETPAKPKTKTAKATEKPKAKRVRGPAKPSKPFIVAKGTQIPRLHNIYQLKPMPRTYIPPGFESGTGLIPDMVELVACKVHPDGPIVYMTCADLLQHWGGSLEYDGRYIGTIKNHESYWLELLEPFGKGKKTPTKDSADIMQEMVKTYVIRDGRDYDIMAVFKSKTKANAFMKTHGSNAEMYIEEAPKYVGEPKTYVSRMPIEEARKRPFNDDAADYELDPYKSGTRTFMLTDGSIGCMTYGDSNPHSVYIDVFGPNGSLRRTPQIPYYSGERAKDIFDFAAIARPAEFIDPDIGTLLKNGIGYDTAIDLLKMKDSDRSFRLRDHVFMGFALC